MRNVINTLAIATLALSAYAWAGPIKIPNRYIEGRYIEAFVNADGTGGTISVRPADCNNCRSVSYEFDASVRVIDGYEERSINDLRGWNGFPGEIAINKSTERLVRIRRTR